MAQERLHQQRKSQGYEGCEGAAPGLVPEQPRGKGLKWLDRWSLSPIAASSSGPALPPGYLHPRDTDEPGVLNSSPARGQSSGHWPGLYGLWVLGGRGVGEGQACGSPCSQCTAGERAGETGKQREGVQTGAGAGVGQVGQEWAQGRSGGREMCPWAEKEGGRWPPRGLRAAGGPSSGRRLWPLALGRRLACAP